MSSLKRALDNKKKSTTEINKREIRNKRSMIETVNSINKNYILYDTDPIINNIHKTSSNIPRKLIINREKIIINREINNISDLIKMLDDYPIVINAEYNIDLQRIHKIKDLLIELNNMIGLHNIKSNILDQILFYIQDLHLNNENDYMHTVLYGHPGTGKTEIAKIIGKIFSKLGILKKETFKKVVRADLIAGYLGQTAIKTTKVIDEAVGGVLFIDEAYALGNSEKRDSFSKECIDTICEALSDHKSELMVIIAGYEEELKSCFFNYNQGLKSRFPWVFKTDKYTPEDLRAIFIKKVNDIKWTFDPKNTEIDIEFFKNNIDSFPYYGRDMELLLQKTKITHGRRVFCQSSETKTILTTEDLEKGFELFKKHIETKDKEDDKHVIQFMYS
jgi:SpoVK/Ycf46/Vps4 family AAA+-type ATPase